MDNVYIDCDGVLLDYMDAYLKFLRDNDYTYSKEMRSPYLIDIRDITDYNLHESLSKWLTNEQVITSMYEFAHSEDWYGMRQMVDPHYIKVLRNLGCKVHVLSCCYPELMLGRADFLTRVYGNVFDSMILVSNPVEKASVLHCAHRYCDKTYFIEDNPKAFDDIPGDIVRLLVDWPYNAGAPGTYKRMPDTGTALNYIAADILTRG